MHFNSCVRDHIHCQTRTPADINLTSPGTGQTQQLNKSQQQKCLPVRLVPAGELDLHPPTNSCATINIATLNTRTLRTQESLLELENSLENIKCDILGISEMRRLGEKIEEYNNYIIYQKGETAGHRGVGFLIKQSMKNYIQELIGISDRIAILNIKLPGYKKPWTVIQVYSPTEQAAKNDIEDFYNNLSDIVRKYYHNNIIVMGDFNAQVGSRELGEESILGNHGNGKRSTNGHSLIEFLLQNNLTLLNSVFKKKPKTKWTWISPDGKYKNEIDFILTNRPKYFCDTHVIQNLNFNTNHRMVRCRLNMYPPKSSRKTITNSTVLPQENYTSNINLSSLKPLLEIVRSDINVQEKYDHLNKKLSQMKISNADKKTNKFSEKILEMLEKRKLLISDKQNSKKNQNIISDLSKQIRENLRKDRKLKRNKKLEDEIQRTGGTKKAFKELREYGKEWIPRLKNNQENQVTKRREIQKLATNYYKNLYSTKDFDQETDADKETSNQYSDIPPILTVEVQKAINSQKLERAPGPDNILNELMRGTVQELSPILTNLFNDIIKTGIVPSQWGESHIILLHKKGNKDDIGNYRPISLISNVYKVFAKVILERITKILDENQPLEQAGFRKGYSTIDHIHTIKQIMEKYNEYQKSIYIAFIDYSKAFDSLNHNYIWVSLSQQGVDSTYIDIIKNIYSQSKSRIKLESKGDSFPINRGVRQGDPLSAKLFTAVLENIFRKLDWDDYGLNINGTRLNHLRFADDLVLLEEDPNKLQVMIKTLAEKSKEVGLEMNASKTKMMTNSTEVNIVMNGNRFDYVSEYVYLGQIISPSDPMSKEINKRIASGWKKYWSLKEIMKSKELNIHIKKKTYNTCILPCITYGCETWSLTENHRMKLAKCQRAMERSMLGVKLKDKIKNTEIRKKTKVADILARIDHQKWGWAGHMLRCKINKWSKLVTLWYPRDSTRRQGRPTRRWDDDIRLTLGPYWTRVADDREQWRQLEEAYAKRHTELRDIL